MIARTLVTNSSSAPSAPSQSPVCAVTPTTASGGTGEMAMATPGRMSPTSRRAIANAPARPVVAAATRSTIVGDTRLVIWLLSAVDLSWGSRSDRPAASSTTSATAPSRIADDRASGRASP